MHWVFIAAQGLSLVVVSGATLCEAQAVGAQAQYLGLTGSHTGSVVVASGLHWVLLFFFISFIYLWLHWVFVAACELSLVVANGGLLSNCGT